MADIAIPDDRPGIRRLFQVRPEIVGPITDLTQILLHAPHRLTRGDRELIGAHVSALNGSTFCRTSHAAVAARLLGDEALVDAVVRTPKPHQSPRG